MTARGQNKAKILSVDPIEDGHLHDLTRRHGRWPYQCQILTNNGPVAINYAINARPSMRDLIAYQEACFYADQLRRNGKATQSKFTGSLLLQ